MLKVYSFKKFHNFAFSMLNNLGLCFRKFWACAPLFLVSVISLFKCHLFRKAFLNYSMSQYLLTPVILLLPIYIITLNYTIYLYIYFYLSLENKLHVGNLFCCISKCVSIWYVLNIIYGMNEMFSLRRASW